MTDKCVHCSRCKDGCDYCQCCGKCQRCGGQNPFVALPPAPVFIPVPYPVPAPQPTFPTFPDYWWTTTVPQPLRDGEFRVACDSVTKFGDRTGTFADTVGCFTEPPS